MEEGIMAQGGRGAAYAALTIVSVWIVTSIWPTVDQATPRIYVGSIGLAIVAALLFAVGLLRASLQTATQSAVTGLAIGSASLAFVGLATTQVAGTDGKTNEQLQAVGLMVVLLFGLVFLFSDGATKISWSNLPLVTTAAAAVLVVAYGATILFMLGNAASTNVTETVWARYLVVFTAVQGVGLAAVGALLGAQVKQGETNGVRTDLVDALNSAAITQQAPPADPQHLPSAGVVQAANDKLDVLRARYLK
jgi:hypothetical protein